MIDAKENERNDMWITNEIEYVKSPICGGEIPTFINSKIEFNTANNLIYCEAGVTLKDCIITLVGEGNIVYLSKNKHPYKLSLRIYRDSNCFFGKENYMNGILNLLVQEHQNVIIGAEGAFSYGIYIMTSDAHLVYDIKKRKRLNDSKSILIGDHVWLGQFSTILKGSNIGSGSIIGANTVITGKKVGSNTAWGGNPGKEIKKEVFWEKDCPNLYNIEETDKYKICDKDENIFGKEKRAIDWNLLDKGLKYNKKLSDRLELLKAINKNKNKDRFYI